MSSTQTIQACIAGMAAGSVFSAGQFLSMGSRAAADQALHRLLRAGRIERVARGLYTRSEGGTPAGQAVVEALALRGREIVAVVHADASARLSVVLTSGASRTLEVDGHTVEFRRASPRKIELARSEQGRALLDLWRRGEQDLTTVEIRRVTAHWSPDELTKLALLIPAWLRQAIEQSNAPRKSAQLGLSGAYDWSNPQIKDSVLIGKVLERHNFADVVRLCAHYGIPRVKRVFRRQEFGPITRASVSRMLINIGTAQKLAQRGAHAQT